MNTIKNLIFNKNSIIYSFITLMMLSTIFILSPFTTELNVIILLWGACYFIYDFFHNKRCIKSRYSILLIIYMIFFIISIIVNYKTNLIGNIKTFAYTGLLVFVLYSYEENKTKEKLVKELYKFNNIIIYISSLVGFASLITFIFLIQFTINDVTQGFIYPDSPALWGFYGNPNSGSMVAVLSIILTAFNIYLCKKNNLCKNNKAKNIYYIINIVIQWIYVILSNSRGSNVSLIMIISFTTFYVLFTKYQGTTILKKFFCYITSIIVAFIVFVLLSNLTVIARSSLAYIPESITYLVNMAKHNDTINNDTITPTIDLDRDIQSGHVSTGRAEIWSYGLNTLKFSPLFGHAPDNIGLAKQKLYPNDTSRYIVTNNMHNGYLQILLSNGIVGFIPFLIFFILFAKDSLLFIFSNKIDRKNDLFIPTYFILMVILAISVNGLFENVILLTTSYITTILWIYLGYAASIFSNTKKLETKK